MILNSQLAILAKGVNYEKDKSGSIHKHTNVSIYTKFILVDI
jgi:hypothetical protein